MSALLRSGRLRFPRRAFADQFFASDLGVGAVSTLSYANRILSLVLSLLVLAATRAVLPILAEARALGHETTHLTKRWAGATFLIGIGALTIGWLMAPTIVRLIFERGTFGPPQTASVANILRFGLLQTPFYVSGVVLYADLCCVPKYLYSNTIVLVCAAVVKVVASFLLVSYLGLVGLQIGSLMMLLVFSGGAALIFSLRGGRLRGGGRKFAVGTLIAERPPRRSVLAEFPHTAPTSGV